MIYSIFPQDKDVTDIEKDNINNIIINPCVMNLFFRNHKKYLHFVSFFNRGPFY